MRILRWAFGLLLIFALLGVTTLSNGGTSTASAAATVWVQVSPSSITQGFQIAIRASCGDTANNATVMSKAFGVVTLQPVNSSLQAEVTIPASTEPATYTVNLTCVSGSSASTTLTVLAASGSQQSIGEGPHTGGGFLANHAGAGLPSGVGWLMGGATLTAVGLAVALISTRRRRPPVRPDAARP